MSETLVRVYIQSLSPSVSHIRLHSAPNSQSQKVNTMLVVGCFLARFWWCSGYYSISYYVQDSSFLMFLCSRWVFQILVCEFFGGFVLNNGIISVVLIFGSLALKKKSKKNSYFLILIYASVFCKTWLGFCQFYFVI